MLKKATHGFGQAMAVVLPRPTHLPKRRQSITGLWLLTTGKQWRCTALAGMLRQMVLRAFGHLGICVWGAFTHGCVQRSYAALVARR